MYVVLGINSSTTRKTRWGEVVMPYFWMRQDPAESHGVTEDPDLPDGVSFRRGVFIAEALPLPLVFTTDNTPNEPPGDFAGAIIPLMSSSLLEALRHSGIDNLQVFPAKLENPDTGESWSDYWAVNVLGFIACADLSASTYTEIIPEGDGTPPLVDFLRLVLDESKAEALPFFRLAECPDYILINSVHLNRLKNIMPATTGALFKPVQSTSLP